MITYDREIREATIIAIKDDFCLFRLNSPLTGESRHNKANICDLDGSTIQPLLILGRSYDFPYPGSFQANAAIYKNGGIIHMNNLVRLEPLFNLDGCFIGYSKRRLSSHVLPGLTRNNKLYIRTRIPVSYITTKNSELIKAKDIFEKFPQLPSK